MFPVEKHQTFWNLLCLSNKLIFYYIYRIKNLTFSWFPSRPWQLWRTTICKCLCTPRTTTLCTPLRPWIPSNYQQFPCIIFYSLQLWHSANHFLVYQKTTNDGIEFSLSNHVCTCTNLPLIPVDILHVSQNTMSVSHCPAPLLLPPPPSPYLSYTSLLKQLLPWKANILSHLQCHLSIHALSTIFNNTSALPDHSFLAACDGSLQTTATFGWTFCNGTSDLATYYGPVHGYKANSYHTKATSLLLLLVFFHSVQLLTKTSSPVTIPVYILTTKPYVNSFNITSTAFTTSPLKHSHLNKTFSSKLNLFLTHLS